VESVYLAIRVLVTPSQLPPMSRIESLRLTIPYEEILKFLLENINCSKFNLLAGAKMIWLFSFPGISSYIKNFNLVVSTCRIVTTY